MICEFGRKLQEGPSIEIITNLFVDEKLEILDDQWWLSYKILQESSKWGFVLQHNAQMRLSCKSFEKGRVSCKNIARFLQDIAR